MSVDGKPAAAAEVGPGFALQYRRKDIGFNSVKFLKKIKA